MTPNAAGTPGDAEIWQQAAAGRQEAFGTLFDRHSGSVYNYLFRRTADWSVAEELTGAVFLEAWRKRERVVLSNDSALPWLLGVARLLLRNTDRARRRYRAALSRAGAEPVVTPAGLGDPADLVANWLDSEQQMAQIRRILSRLPRQQRDVIELCGFAGLNLQAAAAALGVPEGTVKSRLHRARRRLSTELRDASGPSAPSVAREVP